MTERQLAAEAAEREPGVGRPGAGVPMTGAMASTLLALQTTAGNAAVGGLLSRRTLQRCGAGGCTCGGRCASEDEDLFGLSPFLTRQALMSGRTLARQTGGPYHPPTGTSMSCSMADDCSAISTKINYLRHTIRSHQEWDQANPDPNYPGGRHAAEIADLQRALANCIAIAGTKCRGQPQWVPVEERAPENAQQRAERVRRQLYEALPWAVAVLVVALVVACVVAEPCGAAVLAAVAAVAGEEALATVIAILAANGVRLAGT